ncbi:MAG TPA: zf-HC2 domain-containing protein [Chloroflexi bacterium]|jgi:anti-sigma factor RsiW|nr:zf-HC2 domain-containing protein [Chloroflexota bacterium]
MSCLKASEQMSLALDAMLPEEEEDALHAHIAECADCAAEWRALQSMNSLFADVQPATPPPGFSAQVMSRVRQHSRRATLVRRGGVFTIGLLVVAALAIVPLMTMISVAMQNPTIVQALFGAVRHVADVFNTLARAIGLLAGAMLAGVSWPVFVGYVITAATLAVAWFRIILRPMPTGWERTT